MILFLYLPSLVSRTVFWTFFFLFYILFSLRLLWSSGTSSYQTSYSYFSSHSKRIPNGICLFIFLNAFLLLIFLFTKFSSLFYSLLLFWFSLPSALSMPNILTCFWHYFLFDYCNYQGLILIKCLIHIFLFILSVFQMDFAYSFF